MSLLKRLTTLPEIVRRHLAGEVAEAPSFMSVGCIEVSITEPRIAQFGYGDPDRDDDDAELH